MIDDAAMPFLPGGLVPLQSGTFTLNGLSAVVVPCPGILASSLVIPGLQLVSGTLGIFGISAITPGVSFTVVSVALNTSTVPYMVYNLS